VAIAPSTVATVASTQWQQWQAHSGNSGKHAVATVASAQWQAPSGNIQWQRELPAVAGANDIREFSGDRDLEIPG
jgi:hypothetical protein